MNINLKNITRGLRNTLISCIILVSLGGCTFKNFPELPNEELNKFTATMLVDSYTDGDLNTQTMRMENSTYAAVVCVDYTYLIYGKLHGFPAGTCFSNKTLMPRTFSILRFLEVSKSQIKNVLDIQEAVRAQQIEFKKRNSKLYEPGGENYPNDSQWQKAEPEKQQP